ncbi:KTSC domain-containing protein [Saccharothrix sp. ST-888]|uniref:KTSC domain-containing protein n=1 Tax=Saccharothrix sp. ST-888 TaxID=1427391 RepID=UPI0018CDAFD8|nr:KTSC domain-containing protein [Saccharothrix sp. ST-888]
MTPRRTGDERALEDRGLIRGPGQPTGIDSFTKPWSRSEKTQLEIRQAIDKAAGRLSLEKQAALRRADWYGDDSGLLSVRPTNTSDPGRPRTLAAGWDWKSGTLFVRFRGRELAQGVYADGVGYEYYNVSQAEWDSFRTAESPGDYINKVLNTKPYTPATW